MSLPRTPRGLGASAALAPSGHTAQALTKKPRVCARAWSGVASSPRAGDEVGKKDSRSFHPFHFVFIARSVGRPAFRPAANQGWRRRPCKSQPAARSQPIKSGRSLCRSVGPVAFKPWRLTCGVRQARCPSRAFETSRCGRQNSARPALASQERDRKHAKWAAAEMGEGKKVERGEGLSLA